MTVSGRRAALAALCLGVAVQATAIAQTKPPPVAATRVADGVLTWRELSPAQRNALAPLEREWATIDAERQRKWLEVAARFPAMAPADQQRVQARMTDWAGMSPQQRSRARLQFQEAREISASERQQHWQAYQELPSAERAMLAEEARRAASSTSGKAGGKSASALAAPATASREKSTIVKPPAAGAAPKPISPTVVQSGPGATTRLVSEPPAPPLHQQTGVPKLPATPEFVDTNTLLPRRGPQGAAATPPAPAASSARQR